VSVEFAIERLKRAGDPPEQVAEHLRLGQARLDGEAKWARDLATRLHERAYSFDGEPAKIGRLDGTSRAAE
jgi:hypothetical protein